MIRDRDKARLRSRSDVRIVVATGWSFRWGVRVEIPLQPCAIQVCVIPKPF